MMPKVILSFIFCLFLQFSFAQNNSKSFEILLSQDSTFSEENTDESFFIDTNVPYLFTKTTFTGNETLPSNFHFTIEIKKKNKEQSRLKPLYEKQFAVSNKPFFDNIFLDSFITTSGNFDVIVSLVSDSFKVISSSQMPFQILRKENNKIENEFRYDLVNQQNTIDLSKTFVAKYTLEQLRKNISALAPIAEGSDLKVARGENSEVEFIYLKQFFYNFWLNRNSKNPEQAWNDYVVKLNQVAKDYGTNSTPGYQTDRGRIYIKFGIPDKIEKVPNEKNALPYEVWFYYNTIGRGNVKFLFAQGGLTSTEMFLIHSNQKDEVINPSWQQQLLTNPGNAENKLTHRVFEYFKN